MIKNLNLEVLEKIDMTADELAYQLTAYENWGYIDYLDGLIDVVFNEYLNMSDDFEKVEFYNQYLIENNYEIYESFEPEEYFNNFKSPYEAVRAVMFGKVQYNDDYIKVNGYGNLESFSRSQVVDTLEKDRDFKAWAILNNEAFEELRESQNKKIIISKTMELVKQGY